MTPRRSSITPIAVFDISSSSVAGAHALLYPQPDRPVVLLTQSRVDIALQEDIDIDRFVKNTVHSLMRVVEDVRKSDIHQPVHVQLALSAPWYVTQTRTIVYTRSTPFICTKKLIDDLVAKEIEYVFTHDMDRFGSYGNDAVLIDRQISAVILNGYATARPYGKKATSLDLHVTVTVAPKLVIEQFTDVIFHTYGMRKLSITTTPSMAFVVARDYLSAPTDFLILDVGEEITDIAFIKNHSMLYQHSFPVGTHELYRHIASAGRQTLLEARAAIETFRLGKLNGKAKATIETAITSFVATWQRGLQEVLDQGQFGFCLPEQAFLLTDPRFEQLFSVVIKTDPLIKHICVRGSIDPLFVNNVLLGSHVEAPDATVDGVLGMSALFVARYL